MLEWTAAPTGTRRFSSRLGRSGSPAIEAALADAWSQLLDHLDTARAAPWSIILAYLEVEIGGVLLYPTTAEEPNTPVGDLSVQLILDDWIAEYAEIAAQHEQGGGADLSPLARARADARFERQYQALLKTMARTVKTALGGSRLAALRKRDRFAVYYVDQGEAVFTANLIHLCGARPPKAFPAETPRMLFVGLMRKASIHPEDCLKFRGDQVTEATFFGNEFNDDYVAILESIPNVAALCQDLRTLTLRATKIQPGGVERLKALLPHVKVKVVR